jgi:hypothetical protein
MRVNLQIRVINKVDTMGLYGIKILLRIPSTLGHFDEGEIYRTLEKDFSAALRND